MIKCNCCGRENSNYAIYCEGCGSVLTTVSDSTDVKTEVSTSDSFETSSATSQPVSEPAPEPVQAGPVQSGGYTPPEYTYASATPSSMGGEFDSMCVAGFICAVSGLFCCGLPSLVGIILCIIGLARTKTNGKNGRGLAIAGIIIGSVILIGSILILIFGNGNTYTSYSSGRHHR